VATDGALWKYWSKEVMLASETGDDGAPVATSKL
jgi:hypothetical protein